MMAKNYNVFQEIELILIELRVITARIEQLRAENDELLKQMSGPKHITAQQYDAGPRGSGKIPFEQLAQRYHENKLELKTLEVIKEIRQNVSNVVESIIEPANCLPATVAYMRLFEGKTLQEIADELNYSLDYIKKVSAGIELTKILRGECGS